MWSYINNSDELGYLNEKYGNFHDSFVEKMEFYSDMILSLDGSLSYASVSMLTSEEGMESDMYENASLLWLLSSLETSSKVVPKFQGVIDFNYNFSFRSDNLLDEPTLDFKGYRFHFKTNLF
ncbi:hypothetical protein, partial [Enterococcus casseliflavus]